MCRPDPYFFYCFFWFLIPAGAGMTDFDFKVLKPVAAQPSEVHKHGYKESHV